VKSQVEYYVYEVKVLHVQPYMGRITGCGTDLQRVLSNWIHGFRNLGQWLHFSSNFFFPFHFFLSFAVSEFISKSHV
jgi:hypothetical protein